MFALCNYHILSLFIPLCRLQGERSKACGTTLVAGGRVPANKASRQSLADSLSADQAHFEAVGTSLFGTHNTKPQKDKRPKATLFNMFNTTCCYMTFSTCQSKKLVWRFFPLMSNDRRLLRRILPSHDLNPRPYL